LQGDGGVAPRKPASQALVGIAAAVSPAIIGADGPELTQVRSTGHGSSISSMEPASFRFRQQHAVRPATLKSSCCC
jgi:hypothetical protein